MRTRTIIFLFFFAIIFMVAGVRTPFSFGSLLSGNIQEDSLSNNHSADSLAPLDSNMIKGLMDSVAIDPLDTLDSLHRAIVLRNRAIDDSIRLDSINRTKKNGIDAPVVYTANDSLVYVASTKTAHLYGESNVKYQDMDLTSEKIYMTLDSSLVHATGIMDSVEGLVGTPLFKMGSDQYESDTMAFNFKTKKGLIRNVYTEQEDGFLNAERSKRDKEGNLYLQHGRYTTCDDEHPDFYLALSRAKVRPGKDVVFGPAYLVVQDVPLPFAIPYGFFPFSKSYSSGFIMPTYGDETARGFYLRDGGYYFAISDRIDLKLLGEIYTKGSWGFSAASNYRTRYKYSGSFLFSYQDTRNGDKGMPDYTKQTSFKLQWSHRQDAKANPYNTLSASVNFASSTFERNNLTSLYNPQAMTQSTRTSSVSWSTGFSSIGLNLSATANLAQNMRDTTIDMTFPDLNISLSRLYPFKRKHMMGKEHWYEKIALSYTGHITNTIHTKEDKILKSNIFKDWNNEWSHSIPISGSFSFGSFLNINPSFNFTDHTYFKKVDKSWDDTHHREVCDTTYGFYNVYNWNMSVSASSKLYGFFVPNRKIFGDKVQAIRHVFTPTVSFSYAPDFGAASYGYYKTYMRPDEQGVLKPIEYTPYRTAPGKGKTGSISLSIDNNLEMKIKSDKDSTGFKKISLIDQFAASMSYNMSAKERPLSDLMTNIRLKWWKNYTFNLNAVFATYAYELDENDRPYVGTHTEYSKGRFGRFQGMSQNISYTLSPEKLKKLFSGKKDDDDDDKKKDDNDDDTGTETNIDPTMQKAQNGAKKENAGMAETDENGYMKFSMPWSITFSYGVTMRENTSGTFNKKTMRYPYKFTQNLNFSGNIRLSDGWNISFSSGYDFDYKKLSMTTASMSRDLHCFSMSCSIVLAPYTSYNFSFRCNAATLTDALKYDKRSGYSNSVKWY